LLKTFARENAICGEGGKEEKSLVISEWNITCIEYIKQTCLEWKSIFLNSMGGVCRVCGKSGEKKRKRDL
jgi:hypothetical protein